MSESLNDRYSPSQDLSNPLHRFVVCKKSVNKTFTELLEIVKDTEVFLENAHKYLVHCPPLAQPSQPPQHNSNFDNVARISFINEELLKSIDFSNSQQKIQQFCLVITGISKALRRDFMKVVFVGHTSNGKSTVINSMLGQLILPIGIGHTTCSFCSVHGTDGDAYMIVSDPSDSCPAKDGHMNSQESLLSVLSESSEDNHQKEGDTASIRKDSMKKFRCSLTNVAQVASAVSPHSTNPTTRRLVNVFWQKNKCKLLRDEVVLIDSPGLDLDSDYNRWINDYCTDADVFVLVANAESTLKQTEREFFYKVLKKLSKPNIFMLYNRWDSSDMEHFIDEVYNQHLQKAIEFLSHDLGVVRESDIQNRVFFISAREMLLYRTKPDFKKETLSKESLKRLEEFKLFEQKFEECISASAIKTKFDGHLSRGLDIAIMLENLTSKILSAAVLSRTQCHLRLKDKQQQLQFLRNKRNEVLSMCRKIVEDYCAKIREKFKSELEIIISNELCGIVQRFDYAAFHADDESLLIFSNRLKDYLSVQLCELLNRSCFTSMNELYYSLQNKMVGQVDGILDANAIGFSPSPLNFHMPTTSDNLSFIQQDIYSASDSSTLRSPIHPNLFSQDLLDDFKPHIDFSFSLGWRSLAPRFLGTSTVNFVDNLLLLSKSDRRRTIYNNNENNNHNDHNNHNNYNKQIMNTYGKGVLGKVAFSLFSPSSLLPFMTMAATLTTKPTFWKLGLSFVGMFSSLYLWEFLTYTNSSKELSFKTQFARHAGRVYLARIDIIASSISTFYAGIAESKILSLQYEIDEHNGQLQKEIGALKSEEESLSRILNEAQAINEKSKDCITLLNKYYNTYILNNFSDADGNFNTEFG